MRIILGIAALAVLSGQPLPILQAGWSTPVALSSAASDQPDLAVDPSGDAFAIWQSYDGTNYVIQAASLPFSGSWSSAATLSSSGEDAQDPEICVDATGNALAVWSRYDGSDAIIQAASQPSGSSWSSAVDVSSSGGNSDSVEFSIDNSGSVVNSVAVWHRYNGSNFIIQSATLVPGDSWSMAANVSASGQDALIPEVVVDQSGNAVAIWSRFDGSDFIVNGASCLYGQSFGASTALSASGETAVAANVAIDGSGNALAAWSRFDGSNYIVQVATLPFGGAWSSPLDLSAAGGNAFAPMIAMNASGDAIAVWTRFDGTNYIAQVSSMPHAGSWSTATDLSASGFDVNNLAVTIDSGGNAVALWDETDGTQSAVKGASCTAGGSWTTPVVVSSSGAYAYGPVASIDSAGNATALWLEWNGSNYVTTAAQLAFGS
jgi:hypothetical protein